MTKEIRCDWCNELIDGDNYVEANIGEITHHKVLDGTSKKNIATYHYHPECEKEIVFKK